MSLQVSVELLREIVHFPAVLNLDILARVRVRKYGYRRKIDRTGTGTGYSTKFEYGYGTGTGRFSNLCCVNRKGKEKILKLSTGYGTGTEMFLKMKCGYGFRTRLRTPVSGAYPAHENYEPC